MFVKTFCSVLVVVCTFVAVESAVMAEQLVTEGDRVFRTGPSTSLLFQARPFVFDAKSNAFVAQVKSKRNKGKSLCAVSVSPADPEAQPAH